MMTSGARPPRERLTLSEAIDQAGPVLYGTDWIGECSRKEIDILKKYGPTPYGQPQQSIGPCPRQSAVALDRAIGRDRRMLVQRATVFDWLRVARVMVDGMMHCDPASLEKQLQKSKRQKNPVGAPAVVRERVVRQMREAVRSGQLSLKELETLKEEALRQQFRASRRVCVAARQIIRAELSTISN